MSTSSPDFVIAHVMAAVVEVFGDAVRPEDDLFTAGGDSVTAVWLADLLEARLGFEVDVQVVLDAESFDSMAVLLANTRTDVTVEA